ncbi:response regulator [Xylophilus rhododendri]|uniref:histidine kinase n=1 Tax=Xylophilus rhododendri TaxID=2697032 RepID=A0A857IYQ7_9BURK|nr:response regulator [Xylophilus rhododendri]QHI96704.1 response regulator [Xylophilus rhododendri]
MSRPARILVVEDDRVVARDLRQQLGHLGYQVVGVTARGEDAAALARSTSAELALTDIRLEGAMDGIDAAQEIRLACDIPVVFLTAYADDETLRRARLTEPFGYLLKPFEDSQLRTAIEMALYKHANDRKLRESERRYAATLASIGDAVITTDEAGCIRYLNPVAERLIHCRADAALGRPLAELYRVSDEETGPWAQAPGAGLMLHGPGREPVPIEQSVSPLIDERGKVTGSVLVFRDLSHRRTVEKELRDAQAELARVSGLTTMGELAASIAHEINQPLAAIVTNASAGLNWLRRPQPELAEVEQLLGWILADGSRAAGVIKSLQALARKSGPELARLDMAATIHEVAQLMRPDIQRHGVRLQLGPFAAQSHVLGDRIQIQQVLVNLLRNGIEAIRDSTGGSGADSSRLLVVSTAPGEAGEVAICVTDSGDGVAEAHRERLFDAFFTTKPHGMGMGLAICRSIVEAHQGRLWATPVAPRGLRLAFALPAAPG